MSLPDALPAALGNAHADSDAAASLGFRVFFDARFASDQQTRCASCHMPERNFQDGRAVAQGVSTATRNTPTLLNEAFMRWHMWDGKADSAWSAPLLALENPLEMNFTRLEVAHSLVNSGYQTDYEAVFGAMPPLGDAARFPAKGKPGDPAFDGMTAADQQAVNQIFANLGKALEAYVRKIAGGKAPLDAYVAGDSTALSTNAQKGLAVFVQAGCTNCHGGPALSDDAFHRIGVPAGTAETDLGRSPALTQLMQSPFRLQGPFADAPVNANSADYQPGANDNGAFRTPSLRNVANTAPYGHSGAFSTLEQVVDFHLQGGSAGAFGTADPLLAPRKLSSTDRDFLLAFLREGLTGKFPDPPWNYWPNG